ncbi:TPA: hypothetical protein MYM09_001577 [Klebsiella pneumoniae]|uniref:hypothetical protein n=1 Tax=Klebsiella pneumoniae TaxID=573 RepID=UPI000E3EC9C5|nr:hypothetical protein [Klebsiella pneumoniae]EIY4985488.1 hypothetical protein [Klebsiella quasipneumoniae]MDU7173542.1 hypothetical protein [Klebsiella oxytoca]MBC4127867.1 hypothetical protein [Klebsiella pneumoniae]MEC4471584.1 hypothetical protein [Klebsiella pneumoniae]HBR4017699.1 hypothetical protein [Klebsiella pneumoniae]
MGEYFRVTVQVLLDIFLTYRSAKRQQALDKVNALNKVLIDNKIYLTECSDGRARCALTERNLSTEWSRVGDLIQNDSPDLAAFCRNKSDYWVNPKGHSREKVEQLGITIKMLERQIEHLKANML